MRRYSLLFTALLLAPSARANILLEALKEVLEDKITGLVDKNLKNDLTGNQYWGEMIGNLAKGTPEVTVEAILSDFTPESVAKDTGMKLLEFLVPAAAGPINILLAANTAAYDFTNYMLDFYKQQHMAVFVDKVIKPSKTKVELKANYNAFIYDPSLMASMDANVLGSDRKQQEIDFETAYLQRMRELAIAERAEAERKNVKKIVVQKLMADRAVAKAQVVTAEGYLKAAGMDVSVVNIRRFINDRSFEGAVRNAAQKAGQKKEEKPPPPPPAVVTKPPTPPVVPAKPDPVTPVIPPPAQPGGGPIGQSISLRIAGADTDGKRTVDFSRFFNAYKEAADQLVFGDMPPTVFWDVGTNIRAGAQEAASNCLDASGSTSQRTECLEAHKRLLNELAQADANIDQLAAKVRTDLDGLKKKMMSAPKPKEKLDGYAAALAVDRRNAETGGPCGSIGWVDSEKAKKQTDECRTYLGFLATFINTVETKTTEFQEFVVQYEETLAKDYSAYADGFTKNYNLATYSHMLVENYFFQQLTKESAEAQEFLSSKYCAIGEGIIVELQKRLSSLTEVNREAVEQLNLNLAFLAAMKPVAETVEKAYNVPTRKGETLDLRAFDGGAYYDKHFKNYFVDYFSGAMKLLSKDVKGYDPREAMSYKQGSILVWDAPNHPFYKSVADHEKMLKEFSEEVADLKALDLEKRHKILDEAIAKANREATKVQTKTLDSAALHRIFEDAKPVCERLAWHIREPQVYALYYGDEYNLSASFMESVRNDFAARVADIKAREQNMVAVFTKYTTVEPKDAQGQYPQDLLMARGDMNCKKWECSAAVWTAYRAMGDAADKKWEENAKSLSPLKSLTVNGRDIPRNASQSIELAEADLSKGEIVILGELHPGTLGVVSAIKLTLDGQDFSRSLSPGDTFTYSFKPEPGKRYYIGVKIERRGEKQAFSWPGEGDYCSVEFVQGSAEEVKAFYEKFKTAYEGRDAARVMSLISDDWSAGDGTAVDDLEENLRSNFRLYNEIRYSQSGLKISRNGETWQACYDTAITSRIYSNNLKHEEKSAVCDDLGKEDGKLKIVRTGAGSYWYVK